MFAANICIPKRRVLEVAVYARGAECILCMHTECCMQHLPTQVANLMCARVNSTSYPQQDGKWVVVYGLWGEGLVWLIGAVVCLLAANRGSSCSPAQAMDGRIAHCGIISSCQSAATSEIVKRFWLQG